MKFILLLVFHLSIAATNREVLKDESKEDQLRAMAKKNPYITLDPSSFKYFSTGVDRNYSLIVFFKLKGYNLPSVFHRMNENLQKIANSLAADQNKHITNLFVAKVIDNDLTSKFVKKFNHILIPIIVHFSATGEQNIRDLYDVRWSDADLERINFWIKVRTGADIAVIKQFSIVKFAIFLGIVGVCGMVFYLFGKTLIKINNRNTWSVVSIIFVALMQGGLMHSLISGSPFLGGKKDKIEYISGGMRGQYGIEAFIVAGLYCAIAFALIKLDNVSIKKFNPVWKFPLIILLFGSISALKTLVRVKAPWM